MGRLTLNVLLSFAQFEREVTGERIRDKIAASKAKGMWMGGRPPLGYDAVEQRLRVNETEAALVREIFRRYLEVGSVVKLVHILTAEGVRSKSWTTKSGKLVEGAVFSRGALGYLLRNPVYRGAIRHGKQLHWNAHPPIVDEATWSAVQARLDGNGPETSALAKKGEAAFLRGLIFDDAGRAMQPVHANRSGRRYHYYVSSARVHGEARKVGSLPRIPAPTIDSFVIGEVEPLLAAGWQTEAALEDRVRSALAHVTLSSDQVVIELRPEAGSIGKRGAADEAVRVVRAIHLKHRQGSTIIAPAEAPLRTAAPRLDRKLIRAVCLAREWRRELETGAVATTRDLARRRGLCHRHAARLLPLGYLAPDLVQMILEGRQPAALSLQALIANSLPLAWPDQRRLIARFA